MTNSWKTNSVQYQSNRRIQLFNMNLHNVLVWISPSTVIKNGWSAWGSSRSMKLGVATYLTCLREKTAVFIYKSG